MAQQIKCGDQRELACSEHVKPRQVWQPWMGLEGHKDRDLQSKELRQNQQALGSARDLGKSKGDQGRPSSVRLLESPSVYTYTQNFKTDQEEELSRYLG